MSGDRQAAYVCLVMHSLFLVFTYQYSGPKEMIASTSLSLLVM